MGPVQEKQWKWNKVTVKATNFPMVQRAGLPILPQHSEQGGQFHCGIAGRALDRLDIWKSFPPKACGRIWVLFVSSQAIYVALHNFMDNI